MIRLLFLINDLGNGGAERVLVNLANELSKNPEYSITIRCLEMSGPQIERLSSRVRCEGIIKKKIFSKGYSYLYLFPHKWIYKKVVGNGDYDVIIPYLHGVLTRIVAYAPRTQKTVAYLHANMEKSPFIKKIGSKTKVRALFSNYNRIVAVSEAVKKTFINVSGMSDDKIEVVYNTFDVNEIRKLAKEPLNCAMDYRKTNICAVGKLEEVKGFRRLISVAKRLKEKGIGYHLYIVGDGTQRNTLKDMIASEELHEYVTLSGYQKNPYNYINNCDVLVCSSYSEGFSSVVTESIILGKPVVTTDCAGMKEILGSNNEFGIVCQNDEDSLFSGVYSIISDKSILEHYRKKAVERSSFFEPETTVNSFLSMLKDVMEN